MERDIHSHQPPHSGWDTIKSKNGVSFYRVIEDTSTGIRSEITKNVRIDRLITDRVDISPNADVTRRMTTQRFGDAEVVNDVVVEDNTGDYHKMLRVDDIGEMNLSIHGIAPEISKLQVDYKEDNISSILLSIYPALHAGHQLLLIPKSQRIDYLLSRTTSENYLNLKDLYYQKGESALNESPGLDLDPSRLTDQTKRSFIDIYCDNNFPVDQLFAEFKEVMITMTGEVLMPDIDPDIFERFIHNNLFMSIIDGPAHIADNFFQLPYEERQQIYRNLFDRRVVNLLVKNVEESQKNSRYDIKFSINKKDTTVITPSVYYHYNKYTNKSQPRFMIDTKYTFGSYQYSFQRDSEEDIFTLKIEPAPGVRGKDPITCTVPSFLENYDAIIKAMVDQNSGAWTQTLNSIPLKIT